MPTEHEKRSGTDVGKTSGGGSLGHVQPADVAEETPLRNVPDHPSRSQDHDPGRKRDDDPVMPSNDSALNTRI